jgi:putative SOS response-associated peptidase YedK
LPRRSSAFLTKPRFQACSTDPGSSVCNLYRIEKNPDAIRRLFADVQIPLDFPEGIPNLEPRDVRISESAPIVRFNEERGVAELVVRRWSWPGPSGKPVFNMRSDGRQFARDRCLVIADASTNIRGQPMPARSARTAGSFVLRKGTSQLPGW